MDTSYYKRYEPIFGSWHIVREIGEGSFGKVFEIEREDFGYTYKAALKAITIPQSKAEIDSIMDDGMDQESVTTYFKGFVEELIEEFRLMSKLKGESNIVSYEDHRVIEHVDSIGWDILIRMELLTPMLRYTKEHPLTQEDVVNLGIDICKALELCRKHNIVHRDIKPENIFISENGKFKLGDFGIAKTVEKTTGGLSKKGTYTYMAPEVYKGEEYGPSVDIYSLGLVLYRYLNNNRAPFLPAAPAPITHSDRTLAIDRRIKGEKLPAPANASDELARIVLKACAYSSSERYASPTEMRNDLEAVLSGMGLFGIAAAAVAPECAPTVKESPAISVAYTPDDIYVDNTDSAFSNKHKTAPDKDATEIDAAPCSSPADSEIEAKDDEPAELYEVVIPAAIPVVPEEIIPEAEEIVPEDAPEDIPTVIEEKPRKEAAFVPPIAKPVKEKAVRKQPKQKSTEKKSKKPVIAAACVLVAIVVCIFAFGNKPEYQENWTEWMLELPDGVDEDDYVIEEETRYRSRDKETKTSTKSDTLDGWELERTAKSGQFGAWSDWSQTQVSESDTREVETETRYRSKTLETRTGSSSSLSGWDLTDTTYSWGSYGSWSDWSTSAVSSSDSRDVETKKQYRYRSITTTQKYTSWGDWSGWQDSYVSETSTRDVETRTVYCYYYFYCKYCGAHMHCYGDTQNNQWNICYTWMGGCGRSNAVYESSWTTTWSTTPWSQAVDTEGTGHPHIGSKPNYLFTYKDAGSKTQYRYRTRSTYQDKSYGSWSSWSDTAYSSSSTQDVETRTLYRYRDRDKIATYHFQRWSDWSGWTTQAISESSKVKVESAKFYRYRDKTDKTTYIFSRYTDWTEWTTEPIAELDDREIETAIYYRYKSIEK